MATAELNPVTLDDKYELEDGKVFLTGTQALIRLALMQKRADDAAGLKTAGYITGYRGSPLGSLDQVFERAGKTVCSGLRLHAAVNEDLAATAAWGTQQVGLFEPSDYDGVFSMWYGKGPGVHRTGDVFLHANLAGTSPNGGVLALAGDDHTCKSSTNAHQSEFSLVDSMIPTLNPAGVQDILDLGLYGWAMSRYSGAWSGMKLIAETVDSSTAVYVGGERNNITLPDDFELPNGGLSIRRIDNALDQERRLHEWKLPAAKAFARANRLDRVIVSGPSRRIGIISTGKSYLDTLQGFEMLGLDEARLRQLGVCLYKIALVWPLEPTGLKAFCEGLDQVVVVEEKRSLIETQIKEILYNLPVDRRPQVYGKTDDAGKLVLPAFAELTPRTIAKHILSFLPELKDDAKAKSFSAEPAKPPAPAAARTPYFCSGCPHNSSTKVPEGSRAFAGIGCHYMSLWMNRDTEGFTHMGGEGANWIGLSDYSKTQHMFQNMGDGTYFHSGYLAIRAAIAARVNMTYKILFNDAVAMTGGQSMDGELTPATIANQVMSEGAKRVAIVSEDISKYTDRSNFPDGATFHDRKDHDAVQKELREVHGVSVLIFDQTCAAEKRRRRKRGLMEDPAERVIINELVCEGCGDCSKTSNCLSVTPVETEYGTKRRIDQSSCNKDYSCINGFCPSFVSVTGGKLRKGRWGRTAETEFDFNSIPTPTIVDLKTPENILVTGVGGTGVVTIGALLAMAAHLEGKGCSTLDMAGMAQKGGPVTSHIRIAQKPEDLNAARIAPEAATLVLGCDLVVAGGEEALAVMNPQSTEVIINDAEITTADFVLDRNFKLPASLLKATIKKRAGATFVQEVDATGMAAAQLGDSIGANLFMVGVAYQRGLLPVSGEAILKAIELNGVSKAMNTKAFQLGRLHVVDPNALSVSLADGERDALGHRSESETIEDVIVRRREFLTDYQDEEYADRYNHLVEVVRKKEVELKGDASSLTDAVARNAFKLMAYKDEYEVARLFTSTAFEAQLKEQFEGDVKLTYHLAPPLFAPKDKSTGLPRKIKLGGWVKLAYHALAKMKGLRGTKYDLFGFTNERRTERNLRNEYEQQMLHLAEKLTSRSYDTIVKIAAVPDQIRGYGHVKMASIDAANSVREELLTELDVSQNSNTNEQKAVA